MWFKLNENSKRIGRITIGISSQRGGALYQDLLLLETWSKAALFHKVVSTVQFAERNSVHVNAAFDNAVLSAASVTEI